MSWTPNHYPASMKNLDMRVREKAIEIANALLEEAYEEGRAIPIAIAQATKWADGYVDRSQRRLLHIVPHPEGWAVRRANGKKACFVFYTMSEAQDMALAIGQQEQVGVVIHDIDGQIKAHIIPQSYQAEALT